MIYGQTSSPKATPCKYLVVGFALLNDKNNVTLILIRHIPASMSRQHQRPSQSLLPASLRGRWPDFSFFMGMPTVIFYMEPKALYVQMKLLPTKTKKLHCIIQFQRFWVMLWEVNEKVKIWCKYRFCSSALAWPRFAWRTRFSRWWKKNTMLFLRFQEQPLIFGDEKKKKTW